MRLRPVKRSPVVRAALRGWGPSEEDVDVDLFAGGFSDSYVIEIVVGPKGKPVSKTEQVRLAGNSVCPDVAEALIRAELRLPRDEVRRAA